MSAQFFTLYRPLVTAVDLSPWPSFSCSSILVIDCPLFRFQILTIAGPKLDVECVLTQYSESYFIAWDRSEKTSPRTWCWNPHCTALRINCPFSPHNIPPSQHDLLQWIHFITSNDGFVFSAEKVLCEMTDVHLTLTSTYFFIDHGPRWFHKRTLH